MLVPFPAPAQPPPARLLVTAREFRLGLSRPAVKAGPAIIQLVDSGEDPHDLALKRVAPHTRTRHLPQAKPGEVVQRRFRLRAGRYRLWCTLPQHRAEGMRAILRVTRG